MFEKASRLRLRISTVKGELQIEDLWDLSLVKLNAVAKGLNKQLKEIGEEDFLQVVNKEDSLTKLKFDIVLHILNVKKAESDARKDAAEKTVKKQKLITLLEKKRDESLEGLSEEEILKQLDEL